MFKILSYSTIVLLFILGVMIFRPVPMRPIEECDSVNGKVRHVAYTRNNDVMFRLEDNPRVFYVNRGVELKGYDWTELDNQFVELYYPKYWTPLDNDESHRHVSYIKVADSLYFDEIKKGGK